jgi:hypothetical protein
MLCRGLDKNGVAIDAVHYLEALVKFILGDEFLLESFMA